MANSPNPSSAAMATFDLPKSTGKAAMAAPLNPGDAAMADPTPAADPAMGAAQPSTQPEPAPPPPPPPTSDQPKDPAMELDAMRAALAKANEEAKQSRLKLAELEPLAEEARKAEEAQKSEIQRATEAAAKAQADAAASQLRAMQLEAAMAKAPPGTEFAKVADWASRLRGSTPEELAADAELLFGSIQAPAAPAPVAGQQPVEALRPGALPVPQSAPLAEQIAAAEAASDWGTARLLKAQQLEQLRQQTT